VHVHSFSSLSYDRSETSSKASSPHSAIQSFLLQMRVHYVHVTAYSVKIFLTFKMKECSTSYLEGLPVVRIQSHINPIHVDLLYFCMTLLNNTFTHNRSSSKFSLSFGVCHQKFCMHFSFPYSCHTYKITISLF